MRCKAPLGESHVIGASKQQVSSVNATTCLFCVGGFPCIIPALSSTTVPSSTVSGFLFLRHSRPTLCVFLALDLKVSTATLTGPFLCLQRANGDHEHLALGDVLGACDLTIDVHRMVRNQRLRHGIGEAVGHTHGRTSPSPLRYCR